jgi:hypothetical protein
VTDLADFLTKTLPRQVETEAAWHQGDLDARLAPSSSAGSSSLPDFGIHALSRPPRKKPGPCSPPGPAPELDRQKPKYEGTSATLCSTS